jgi:hypothetical protein
VDEIKHPYETMRALETLTDSVDESGSAWVPTAGCRKHSKDISVCMKYGANHPRRALRR